MLKDWLVRRRENPYPSRDEKKSLAIKTGLTYIQVSNLAWRGSDDENFNFSLFAHRFATGLPTGDESSKMPVKNHRRILGVIWSKTTTAMPVATSNNSAYVRMIAFGRTKNGVSNTSNGNAIKRVTMPIRIRYSTTATANTLMHRTKQLNMVDRIETHSIHLGGTKRSIWPTVRKMNRTIDTDWWHAFQRNNVIRWVSHDARALPFTWCMPDWREIKVVFGTTGELDDEQ